jgi:hypothetical protein
VFGLIFLVQFSVWLPGKWRKVKVIKTEKLSVLSLTFYVVLVWINEKLDGRFKLN